MKGEKSLCFGHEGLEEKGRDGTQRDMTFIADLHIHSHFSRATSQDLIPEDLSVWAQKKGITLIGTGDFTHPGWVSELREKLVEAETGLYRLNPDLEGSGRARG